MLILGIESSCDDTAAAVVEDGRRILSSVVSSQIDRHQVFGGVVPEIAGRLHAESISYVVADALEQSGKTLKDIDAIAVTAAPGLIGSLLVGVGFAKGLSFSAKLPLVPVHHLRGHIAANYIAHKQLEPPFLCLVVSGGHSHIVEVKDFCDMRVVGCTRDDAAGEAFDKTARAMGLPYPGGVYLDKIAEEGDPTAFKFPKARIEDDELAMSFSGMKTAVVNTIHNMKQKGEELPVADLAACVRKNVCDMLIEKFLLAAKKYGYKKLAVAGGVSANSELRRRLDLECKKLGAELYYPPLELCGDNAAMIASQGYFEYLAGHTAGYDLNASAGMNIDSKFE